MRKLNLTERTILAELRNREGRRPVGQSPEWWPAIAIAERFGIRPCASTSSRERAVRILIDRIRETTKELVASLRGYALVENVGEVRHG